MSTNQPDAEIQPVVIPGHEKAPSGPIHDTDLGEQWRRDDEKRQEEDGGWRKRQENPRMN